MTASEPSAHAGIVQQHLQQKEHSRNSGRMKAGVLVPSRSQQDEQASESRRSINDESIETLNNRASSLQLDTIPELNQPAHS